MIMKFGNMDAKKKAIEELMGYLDDRDGKDLGEAIKPKGLDVEVTKVKKLGEPGEESVEGDESPGEMSEEGSESDSEPKMSEEEMDELIQAIQSKLGS